MTKKEFRRGRITAVILAVMLAMTGVSGCAGNSTSQTGTAAESSGNEESGGNTESSTGEALSNSNVDTEFSDRDKDGSYSESDAAKITLNGSQAEAQGDHVTVSGSTVTISGEGTYIVTGTLEDGQIIVDGADTDKVQIVLKDADIHCETSAAIYVKSADKVFVTLADGSTSKLSGGTQYTDTDDNTVDGVIFSKSDLTVNGSGTLEIDANYKHGIVSKDTLAVTGGTLSIDAVSQCLSGKDGVKIADGTFQLTTQGKAIKSENEDDTTLGNIYVAGGTFTIKSEDDAFHAGGSLVIDGGTITVETGDDAFHGDQDVVINGGTLNAVSCYEGLEGHRVTVNGGDITIKATDDGVNAADPDASSDQGAQGGGQPPEGQFPGGENGGADGESRADMPQRSQDGRRNGSRAGETTEGTGDTEAAGAESGAQVPGGTQTAGGTKAAGTADSTEVTEAAPESGETTSDGSAQNGQRPSGGRQGGMGFGNGTGPGGGMGGGSMENDTDAYIKITGGTLTVDAGGDGLDSNGSMTISGGTVYVSGSESGADSAIDYNGDAVITGGIVIAAGSAGMAQGFGDSSTQYSIAHSFSGTQEAGTSITLTDESGKVLASWTPEKKYTTVVVSSPELKKGGVYTLTAGTESAELTLESVVTSNLTSGGAGFGGRAPREETNSQDK